MFEALVAHLSDGQPARSFEVADALVPALHACHLITAKPVLYVANVDDASLADGNAFTAAVEAFAEKVGAGSVRLCGQVEAELSELSDEDKLEFLAELGERGCNRRHSHCGCCRTCTDCDLECRGRSLRNAQSFNL